jgi:hypothetical protein
MVRYFYAWTPLVIVWTVVLLSLPWLGLIALTIAALAALVALTALVLEVLAVPYALGRAVNRRVHGSLGVSPGMAAPSPTERRTRSSQRENV